jgi:RNA polymerase sigma-70 factor (ECF subfamily)
MDAMLKLNPGGDAEKYQRIFPAAASYQVKECGMCDQDESLVARSQRGDQAAFADLVCEHQRMIHSLTYRMTGSVADAEDLAQETFINAYRQIGSYRGECKFSTWLYRIAINACLSWRRQETRRTAATAEWAKSDGAHPAAEEDPGKDQDWSGPVQAALLRLPARQRAAIMLTMHDGLNHAEAAAVMNCSETTISWRVFTARRKLKRWLAAGGRE